ncbi:permease [Altibacter sp. HG106]|uniref:permease n=1 Tax=Altibacter sp. HG106 TaxID=3023937 RepID=UPI0023500D87|nr:permease [Altibacter sp. HG106]MDC7995486.1 permease [Altibacter sp. HG106]
MDDFLTRWGEAAHTSLSFFWMALWAFVLGYIISSMIQVFVTEERMQKTMGSGHSKGVLLGTFFGFISSSCSFAALASTKSLFKKGASFVASMAFLLASTNLVIELGVIIAIFLGWQFVVGEYVGGILLIGIVWLLLRLIQPIKLIKKSRERLEEEQDTSEASKKSWKDKLRSSEGWAHVARQYKMEWQMVWKDVTIGFTIAGIVAAFVPDSFFQTLFINSGTETTNYSFLELLQHAVIGPVAAFLTFIGSMGNIPLAALLFGKGVSFAGVMAFIFSDLVVFPVVRINAKYYGWRMSLFIVFLLFTALIGASLLLHYGFDLFGMLPETGQVSIQESDFFAIDYTFFLNLVFLICTGLLIYIGFFKHRSLKHQMGNMAPKGKWLEQVLKYGAWVSYVWLTAGIIIYYTLQ